MTLLISVFAAIISTAVWYFCAERKKYLLNVPCYIFWGASVMWFVDGSIFYSCSGGYAERCVFRFFDYCIGSHCLDNYIADKGPE